TGWSSGSDAYFAGAGTTAAGTITLPTSGNGENANNLYFDTSGYTLAGGALNLSGGTITVQPGDVATTTNLLSIQNSYTVQGGGTLALFGPASLATTNTSTMNIATGSTLSLANTTGTFASLSQWALGASGTINGNLVISQPYQETEFMPYPSASPPAAGASYYFSGSGTIDVAAPGSSIATHKNSAGGPNSPGWNSYIDVPRSEE